MVSFGKKAKIKKAGNLNYGRCYVITTVTNKEVECPYSSDQNRVVSQIHYSTCTNYKNCRTKNDHLIKAIEQFHSGITICVQL